MKLSPVLLLLSLGAASRAPAAAAPALVQQAAAPVSDAQVAPGPRPEPLDPFHPDRATPAVPAYGGTLTLHIESLPSSLNLALLNTTIARNLLFELHATLLRRDWESWELVPELATGWEVEDTLVEKDGTTIVGRVSQQEDGVFQVRQGSETAPAGSSKPSPPGKVEPSPSVHSIAPEKVERVERGTVITFHLRPDVRWHDGHPFDAEDVLFSWRIAANPLVNCVWVRPYLKKIVAAEALDAHTVRFTFAEQYFNSLSLFVDAFCLLPRHLYDLRDPDHPRYEADASGEACAKEINENPHNTEWVGLGPYRLTSYSQQGVTAERFPGTFERERPGYVDRIVWRHIPGDEAAFQALLNGELDFTQRISSDQYFGEATQQKAFAERYCKGYFYLGAFNYVPWNLRRPILSDLRVRKALAHALDLEGYVQNVAHGLALLPTGPQCIFGPSYNHDVQRLGFDLARSTELFAEAGWYDRDGDGVIDKDGKPFEIEMLVQAQNKGAELFAAQYQATLAKVGARLKITPVDSATYSKRVSERDFDAGMAAWSVDVTENDPLQLWHSSAATKGGSNHPGVVDPRVDALIEKGDRELVDQERWKVWRELHRYLYEEVQPYLYREAPARKFALNKALRGVQFFKITPGYSPRRWFYPAGTPGTRATLESK